VHIQVLFWLSLLLLGQVALSAQTSVGVTEVTPNLLVFSTTDGNVLASVGKDGAFLVGTPTAASTPQISRLLAERTQSPFRYVIIAPHDPNHSEGDAGWQRRGAFVAMQENALQRLGGDSMGAPPPPPARFAALRVERPRMAFSEVLAFDLNGEAIHVVHQKPGYSNADCLVHFHVATLVYLGEAFPGDGYPKIDESQGGTLDGLVKTLDAWTDSAIKVVPARGKLTNGGTVKAFREMIVIVRDRVQRMVAASKTESEVVAEHPTSDFDAEWGHGRVRADDFIREVYASLVTK
jgi:hypothetical protein